MIDLRPDNCIRVFPRRTSATPADELAFVGEEVPLIRPPDMPVRISCAFTWDRAKALELLQAWTPHYADVSLAGPAFGDPGGPFAPGLFLKRGLVITSRGCPNACAHCFVHEREGPIRELPITPGWDVQDNNLLACSRGHIEAVFAMLRSQGRAVRFSGGLEAAWIGDPVVSLLQSVRLPASRPAVFTAYDRPEQEWHTRHAIELLRRRGLKRRQVGCYVLVGYRDDTCDKAEARLREVWEWGALPFAMLYRDSEGETTAEWQKFQRSWCRPAAIFATMRAT